MWITTQVMIRNWIMPQQRAVIATEPVIPIIADASLLGEAAGRFEDTGPRLKTKVAATDIDLKARRNAGVWRFRARSQVKRTSGAMNGAAQKSVRPVNPIIQSQAQAVDTRLVVFGDEALQYLSDDVG